MIHLKNSSELLKSISLHPNLIVMVHFLNTYFPKCQKLFNQYKKYPLCDKISS